MQRSPRSQRTQKKPPREEKVLRQQMSEEKKENAKLRREVARLSREICNLKDALTAEPNEPMAPRVLVPKKIQCCDTPMVKVMDVPTGLLKLCSGCGHRDFVPHEARLSA